MLEVTEVAREKVLESVKQYGENPAVRVYIAGSG